MIWCHFVAIAALWYNVRLFVERMLFGNPPCFILPVNRCLSWPSDGCKTCRDDRLISCNGRCCPWPWTVLVLVKSVAFDLALRRRSRQQQTLAVTCASASTVVQFAIRSIFCMVTSVMKWNLAKCILILVLLQHTPHPPRCPFPAPLAKIN